MRRRHAARTIQRRWRLYTSSMAAQLRNALRDMTVCVVCGDECVRVVRCAKGHSTCAGCNLSMNDNRCAICRDVRGTTVDTMLPLVLEAARCKLRCQTCYRLSTPAQCELHRAWCEGYRFLCPWHTCQRCVPAAEMASHVEHHANVHRLQRQSDGGYHAILGFTRVGEQFIFCIGDATVVLHSTTRRVSNAPSPHPLHALSTILFHIVGRAYYPTTSHPAILTELTQLRATTTEKDAFLDRHHLGPLPPMLASSETVVIGGLGAWVAPRCIQMEPHHEEGSPIVLPNSMPSTTDVGLHVRSNGILDAPTTAATQEHPMGVGAVALIHVRFELSKFPIVEVQL